MAYNRYRRKERFKRQYTFTTTKAVLFFIVSATFSISLSAYFDRYGVLLFHEARMKLGELFEAAAQIPQLKHRELRQQASPPSTTQPSPVTP